MALIMYVNLSPDKNWSKHIYIHCRLDFKRREGIKVMPQCSTLCAKHKHCIYQSGPYEGGGEHVLSLLKDQFASILGCGTIAPVPPEESSTKHHVRSGSLTNFQNPDCTETGRFPLWTPHKSGFSLVRQDLSGKFGCPVLSHQETHMPSPVESYPRTSRPPKAPPVPTALPASPVFLAGDHSVTNWCEPYVITADSMTMTKNQSQWNKEVFLYVRSSSTLETF